MGFRLAHISDLHVGKHFAATARLAGALEALDPDWIACTGDVTEDGLLIEKVTFDTAFAAVRARTTIVPGNHDRCGNDVAKSWAKGLAWIERPPDSEISLVCLDSTQPMNATKFMASGHVDDKQRRGAVAAVQGEARAGRTPVVLLHHHLLPLPPDGLGEMFAEWGELPFLEHVNRGNGFARSLGMAGAKLVLHGHKHRPAQKDLAGLSVVNAGSTTELGAFRMFEIDRGEVIDLGWFRF